MDIDSIRKSERKSHEELYSNKELYKEGSWLNKPIKTVLDILPLFEGYEELRVLDVGSGVGRNSIAIAKAYKNISCRVDCVDILELAIEKLKFNAEYYDVAHCIHGIVSAIEDYEIAEGTYDLVLAVSALEHIDSKESFLKKLMEIGTGIREKGVVCLVINSEVKEADKITGEPLQPQFEVNLLTEELQESLQETFAGWEIIKTTVREQKYDIPRENVTSELKTKVVTFVARKGEFEGEER